MHSAKVSSNKLVTITLENEVFILWHVYSVVVHLIEASQKASRPTIALYSVPSCFLFSLRAFSLGPSRLSLFLFFNSLPIWDGGKLPPLDDYVMHIL